MGLVQVEPNDLSPAGKVEIDEVKIIWDEEVEQISQSYGKMIVDYVKGVFLERFIIRFERGLC